LEVFSKRTAHGAVQPPPVKVNSEVGFGIASSFLHELKVKRLKTANKVEINCFIFLKNNLSYSLGFSDVAPFF